MFSNKRFDYVFKIFLTSIVLFFTCSRASASEIDPRLRVRIAEGFNSPPSVLLLMQINDAFIGMSEAPPVWQTITATDAASRMELEKASVIGVYDMLITADESYLQTLERIGVLRLTRPVYSEKMILVGPVKLRSAMSGMDTRGIMSKISSDNILFFSQLVNDWTSSEEKKLWSGAGVSKPYENKNYVESDRDDLSLLIQAEEEEGFLLIGEGSFAQYMEMVREDPILEKFTDTGTERRTYAALIVNAGYRKERTAAAEKYIAWLSDKEGAEMIENFELGGIHPFKAVQ